MDRLEHMFELRQAFMEALSGPNGADTLDLTLKEDQRHLRDVSVRGVEEVWEALSNLRNWKPHRQTDLPDFNREAFLEEWIDAFNYFFTALIKSGFSADDVYQMYVHKDKIIHERLKNGY